MIKRVMNPKKIDENTYITAEFFVDENTYELSEDSRVYICKYEEAIERNFNEDVPIKKYVNYTINAVRANAYKMRNIKKFFAVVNSELGKDYVKEHRDEFRKMIGDINSTIFEMISGETGKDWVISIEVTLGVGEDDKPYLKNIRIEAYKPVNVYKVVSA